MLDGVVAFDLERYPLVPGALDGHAERAATARRLCRDAPEAEAAARTLLELEAWLDDEARRARSRWRVIRDIPGIDRLEEHRWSQGEHWLEADWFPGDHDGLQSYEQLRALAAYLQLMPVASHHERTGDADRASVDLAFEVLPRIGSAEVAAHLLTLLGTDGFQHLAAALVESTGDPDDPAEADRFAQGALDLARIAGLATLHDGDTPAGEPPVFGAEELGFGDYVDQWQSAVAAEGAAVSVAEDVARLTGTFHGDVARTLSGLGRGAAALAAASVVIDVFQHGPFAETTVENALVTGLGMVGTAAGGWTGALVVAGALVLGFLFSLDDAGGTPPRRTYPTDQESPGGSHYEYCVDGAGIPVVDPAC